MISDAGWLALQRGDLKLAFQHYEQTLQQTPFHPQIWLGLALLAWKSGEGRRAEIFFQKSLILAEPDLPLPTHQVFSELPPHFQQDLLSLILALIAAWHNSPERKIARQLALHLNTYPIQRAEQACILASLLQSLGELGLAENWCLRSLEIAPSAQAWFILAQLRFAQQDRTGAEYACQQALQQEDQHWETLVLLGHLCLEMNQPEAAVGYYQAALKQKPDYAPLHFHLGGLYQALGQIEAAHHSIAQALQLDPGQALWQLQQELLFPLIPDSYESLTQILRYLETRLSTPTAPLDLNTWQEALTRTNLDTLFDLHYLMTDALPLRQKFAQRFQRPPTPYFHLRTQPAQMGVLVTPRHEGIFIFLAGQLLARIDPEQIQIRLLIWQASENIFRQDLPELTREIVPGGWAASIQMIQAQALDLVYFWEAGTDPLNYFMPWFRLGRVQFTSWGSAGSTAIPEMDYFISSQGMEGPEAETRYTEKLLQMQHLPFWYDTSRLPHTDKSRTALGLPEDKTLALFPHNLLKLHPEFDAVLAALCQACPELLIVLVSSRNPVWTRQIQNRLERQIPSHQLLFLPRLNAADFVALLHIADFALDPWPYGAGKVAIEALGMGLPLLTRPGNSLKNRITAACYQAMEFEACVVHSTADYLERAIRLAQDREWRQQIRKTLSERQQKLFGNDAAVLEFTQILLQMHQA